MPSGIIDQRHQSSFHLPSEDITFPTEVAVFGSFIFVYVIDRLIIHLIMWGYLLWVL